MNTVLYYVLSIGSIITVAGGIMAFIAMRNAPEGYENEEGFVGMTKGDEQLLNEFAAHRRYTNESQPGAGLAA